ncbi:MAG: type II toxin-antitoxin system VapC family toxin [Candidatus Halalkalibacterium sp. M3_1C_030]
MNNVVIDASVAFKWLVWEDGSDEAIKLLENLTLFHAPDIFLMEMDAILTRKVRKGELELAEATEKRKLIRDFPYLLITYEKIAEFTFRLSTEFSVTLYDASYLATAVETEAIFYTADRRLSNGLSTTPFSKYVKYVGS